MNYVSRRSDLASVRSLQNSQIQNTRVATNAGGFKENKTNSQRIGPQQLLAWRGRRTSMYRGSIPLISSCQGQTTGEGHTLHDRGSCQFLASHFSPARQWDKKTIGHSIVGRRQEEQHLFLCSLLSMWRLLNADSLLSQCSFVLLFPSSLVCALPFLLGAMCLQGVSGFDQVQTYLNLSFGKQLQILPVALEGGGRYCDVKAQG